MKRRREGQFRVRLEDIRMPAAVPAGMNVLVLMSLAYRMRATLEDPPAVILRRRGKHWQIHDGRHRCFAAMIAGRADVLAEELGE